MDNETPRFSFSPATIDLTDRLVSLPGEHLDRICTEFVEYTKLQGDTTAQIFYLKGLPPIDSGFIFEIKQADRELQALRKKKDRPESPESRALIEKVLQRGFLPLNQFSQYLYLVRIAKLQLDREYQMGAIEGLEPQKETKYT